MTDITLERLGAGIKAAHDKGDMETVKKLGQAYRQLEAQQKGKQQNTGISDAAVYSLDSAGRSLGKGVQSIGEMAGLPSVENYGKEWAASNEADIAKRGYKRPEGTESITGSLSKGNVVDAAKALGYAAVESAPSIGVGAVASLSALASAPLAVATTIGATALGSIQALGDIRSEKEQKNLDPKANLADIGSAIASGLIELVPLGKGGGFTLKFLKEGAQEAGQEGIIIGDTALQGGEYVPQEVGDRLLEAGAAGGAISKGVEYGGKVIAAPAKAAANYVKNTDDLDVTDDHVRLAERLKDATGGDLTRLANVSSTDAEEGAQSYAKAVLGDLRAEASKIAQDLSTLARANKNREAEIAISRVLKNGAHLKSTITQENIDSIVKHFPDQADSQRLTSITNQIKLITPFTNAKADIGGLSKFTGMVDITDIRGRGFAGGAGAALAVTSGPVGLKAIAGGVAINRTAQFIDRMTNRRSRIKRFVDSVDKKSTSVDEISGPTARDSLDQLKELVKEAKRANAENEARGKAAEKAFEAQKKADLKAISLAEKAQTKAAAKAPSQRVAKVGALDQSKQDLYTANNAATADMFETGDIPEDNPNPIFQGYSKWKQATGLAPAETLETLEVLESEGTVPKGTAQRFREDIYSFKKDKMTPAIQEQVRKRANPEHKPKFDDLSADKALRKLEASSVKPSGSRRKQKAKEGERRAQNVVVEIEGAVNALPAPVYRALHKLKEAIDRPDMTAEMRGQLVDETLPTLFGEGPVLDHWNKVFTPLVTIGNDYVIERKVEQEAKQEQAFETKVEEVKKKAAKKRPKKSADPVPDQKTPELDLMPTETTADMALQKLVEPKATNEPVEEPTEAIKAQDAKEPKTKKAAGSNNVANMVTDRVAKIEGMLTLAAERGQDLADHMDSLPPSVEGRVERIILELATDQMTVNMVSDIFAERFGVPPVEAAKLVFKVLSSWQDAGKVKLFRMFKNDRLKVNGEFPKDENGEYLEVLSIEALDEGLVEALNVAKAVSYTAKMVNQDRPDADFTPDHLTEGPHKALSDFDREQVDASFKPILDFLNAMRNMKHAIHPDILTQIETALDEVQKDTKRGGTIVSVLKRLTDTLIVVDKKTGKARKVGIYDEGPLRVVAQLLFQLGNKGERTDTRIRQEWSAGRNLRVYSKNGVAHSQGGDIMKGLLRTDQKHNLGSESALKFMFHSFGNILGFDKLSPLTRREAIFQPGRIEALLAFADDPFGRNTLTSSRGNGTEVAAMIKDGEGFFQVLNVAHEVKRMVAFAKARNKKPGLTDPAKLLKDPDVQADLIKNYQTDFIVQLDASNNAYQLAGLVMGYMPVLQATGLQQQSGGVNNPDDSVGADIYMATAKAVVDRLPDLASIGLPDSKIRKLFKKSIGTYLYAAEFNSRKASFKKELKAIAGDAPIFGTDGAGLIEAPANVLEGLLGPGFTFQDDHYNVDGDIKETIPFNRRVVEKNGYFYIGTQKGKTKETVGKTKYASKEDAAMAVLENDLYARINREMIRDFETRFPAVRDYLNFANKVAEIVRAKGGTTINVPTPDGIMLEYAFKETGVYTAAELATPDGKTVRLGVKTPDVKIKGRGLAAFMTHQLDAYVLRETHRRMAEKGIKSFNPIHDSFGFHPSDAEAGQAIALEVMQELGNKDFNLFAMILQANGLMQAFQNTGGVVPNRQHVQPMPPKSIPTALS